MQNLESKPNDNIHSERRVILDLQSSLIDIWNEYKIPEFYQNLFINYIKVLSNTETEIVIKEQMKAIVNGSCYIQAFEKCLEDRHKIQQFLKITIEQDRERRSEQGLSMVCQYVSRLRDINYKSSYYLQKIRGKFQQEIPIHKSAEKYFYNKFAIKIDCFRKELLKSYMSRYAIWDQQYDPFFIGIKERIKHPSRKVNESISDLFDFSIDQSYKFLKMRKVLITWLYMDPKKKNSNAEKILNSVGLPELKNSRYTNYEDIKKEIIREKSKQLHRKESPIRVIPSPTFQAKHMKYQPVEQSRFSPSTPDRDLFKTKYRKNNFSPRRDQPNYVDQSYNFDRMHHRPEIDHYPQTPDHLSKDELIRASQARKFNEHFGINKSTVQINSRRLSKDAGKIKRGRFLFNPKNQSIVQIPVNHSPSSMPTRSNSMNVQSYDLYPRRLNSIQSDYRYSPMKQSVCIQTDINEASKSINYRKLQKKLMISIEIQPHPQKNSNVERENKETASKADMKSNKYDQADEKLASKKSGNPHIKNTQVQINYEKNSNSKQNEPIREEKKPIEQSNDKQPQRKEPQRYENEKQRVQSKEEYKESASQSKTNKSINQPIKKQIQEEAREQYDKVAKNNMQKSQYNSQSSEPKQSKFSSNLTENNKQSTPIFTKQQQLKPNQNKPSYQQEEQPSKQSKTSQSNPKSQIVEPISKKPKPLDPSQQQQPTKQSNMKQQSSVSNQSNSKQSKILPQQSQNPTPQTKKTPNQNDSKQAGSNIIESSDVKSTNNAKDQKRQIKMRVGKLTFEGFKEYLYSYEFNPDYIKLYDMKRVIKQAQFSQTYLTEYLVNNQPAAIALCGLTPPNNAMVIRFWAMAKGFDSSLSLMLFKKYADYVEKSITSENLFYKGEELQQLKSNGFELKKDKLYGRKRTTEPREIDSEFESFLYIECSHIKFIQKQKEDLLFSQQIERFNAKNSYSADYLFTMKKTDTQDLEKMIKINEKLPNFAAVNKILTKEDFDNYEVTQKINPQSIDLLRFYLSSEFRDLFVAGDGLFKFYGSEVYTQQGKVIYSIKTSKSSGRLCFGKGYKQIDEFISNLKEETTKKVVFTVPMFNKKLYGRYSKVTANQIGFYGNWQIGLVWEDEMQGRLKYSVQSCLAFGDSNFYMSIQVEDQLIYAIQVNKDDYIF